MTPATGAGPVDRATGPAESTGSAGHLLVVAPWPGGTPALPTAPRPAAAERWSVSRVDPAGVVARGRPHGIRDRPVAADLPAATRADPDGAASALRLAPDTGWHADGDTWRHEDPAVTATVRAHVQHDADGRALLAALRGPTPDDLGRPDVTELPDELADGMLVVRRQVLDGALVLRVDLARRAWDAEVLVSAVLPDPAVADDAVAALVRLLAAIVPQRDRLTA